MGFIAELESTELSELARLARGEYSIDSRMMLDVTVRRGNDLVFHDIALNDVAITKGAVARIVHLNVRCDGVQAMDFGGDGLLISTPTGSTAYSLSAGGPIVEPDARSILLTPICAHDIVSKCIVTSDKRTITVAMAQNARRNAFLSVDGGRAYKMNMGDVASITCSRLETRLIRLKDRSFYDIINNKLRHYD
jgi:NAD+ kinase